MGKSTIRLPDGRYATEDEAINALAGEAKRRGISYGTLVASTTEFEQNQIIRNCCAGKRKKRKKG